MMVELIDGYFADDPGMAGQTNSIPMKPMK
jgi:hypothetical protein